MRRNKSINTVLGKSFFHRDFITSSTYVKCQEIVWAAKKLHGSSVCAIWNEPQINNGPRKEGITRKLLKAPNSGYKTTPKRFPAPSTVRYLQTEGSQHDGNSAWKWTPIKTITKKDNKSGKGPHTHHLWRAADISGSIWGKCTRISNQTRPSWEGC